VTARFGYLCVDLRGSKAGQHVAPGRAGDHMLFGAIPGVGDSLVEWIRGDYFMPDIGNGLFRRHVFEY
jgi:quinol-cytochrome oxidoreductase complex cytochrome b subunit